MREQGLLSNAFSSTRLRLVTHLDVSGPDIDEAIGIINRVLKQILP
jgi:threonine aldolase